MNSLTTIFAFAVACILVRSSASRISATEQKVKATVAERVAALASASKKLGTKQEFLGPCSCEEPCKSGVCSTATAEGVESPDQPVCIPKDFNLGLGFVDIKPIDCGGVCIAADMLGDFASHELVFEKHVLAPVLCDASGSCATKGHIVKYMGRAMMMGSYCDIVGCEKKVMEVNSPRYSRGMKVESKSQDMHFTAFAARFETRGEEAVLAAAVRVGL